LSPEEHASPQLPASDLLAYSRFNQVLRSWFWRYYDHLGHLILYNLGWFLTCFLIGWAPARLDLLISPRSGESHLNPWALYLLFVVECGFSVGWAYLIFRVFNLVETSFSEFWRGALHFLPKAIGLSAISGLVLGLVFYNVRFYYLLGFSHWQNMTMAGVIGWFGLFWMSSFLYQWPILFFQDPPFFKIIYRSFLLTMANGLGSLGILLFLGSCFCFFTLSLVLWFFLGFVFFFSFQCVLLEKHFLRYKIIYGDKPLEPFLERLQGESQRGWRDFLKPWDSR